MTTTVNNTCRTEDHAHFHGPAGSGNYAVTMTTTVNNMQNGGPCSFPWACRQRQLCSDDDDDSKQHMQNGGPCSFPWACRQRQLCSDDDDDSKQHAVRRTMLISMGLPAAAIMQ
ncbi:hypothetical protein ACOMHN_028021 [Nucella lapillus]